MALLIKTRFLVPLQDNEGRLFSAEDFEAVEHRLVDAGLNGNRTPDVRQGWWRDVDGRLYFDRCNEYEVGIESWKQLGALIQVVEWARVHFRQQAMYFEAAGIPEIL